jgi:hypothetical protein
MEDLTLPSVGASFKKWRCCTPIFPEVPKIKNIEKREFF